LEGDKGDQLMVSLFGKRAYSMSAEEKRATRNYLIEELKIALLKDREAAKFYLGEDSEVGPLPVYPTTMVAWCAAMPGRLSRFQVATEELVVRHSSLVPPANKKAVENHRAWQAQYEAYRRWVFRVAAAVAAGHEPHPSWIKEATRKAIAASKHTQELHRMLQSTPEDLQEMTSAAMQGVEEESWYQ
jgi:hypothetical protein